MARRVSTGVDVSIHGLMAYSTVKKVGAVMAYRRVVWNRSVIAATSDTGAVSAATSEIVMIKRYGGAILQSIAVHCVSTSDSLCQNELDSDLLRGSVSVERLDETDERILAELAEDAR